MQTSGGEQASDLPGYYKNSVPACKESKSGGTLDKTGNGSRILFWP